jgi:hypothetical protein
MTDKYNGYPTNTSGSEVPNNAPPHPHEENKTRRRDFLLGLSLGGAALAVGAGLSAAIFGHNRSSSASSETPSPSESPSSSSETTPSATATETPPPTQEPVEPGAPSSERPEPRRSYNFANLSEFDSEKWKTMSDYDKGLACKTLFGNNLKPEVMTILTESRADQSKELAITWFDHADRFIRDLCDDAQSNALFTNADGREVNAWPVLQCLADYIDVPHSNIVRDSNDENKDDSDKNKFKPHGYYGRLVEAAYEAHSKDKKPKEEDRIALRVTKYAQIAPYKDPFPINDGKETNRTQEYSAAYCEVGEIGEDGTIDKNRKLYDVFIERQRRDLETGQYKVHLFPRIPYFYPTDESGYEARGIKPEIYVPLNDIKES